MPPAILRCVVEINTCYSVHQVSMHWQNQCSQTASTHQTLGSSDQQGDTQSMMQTPLSATGESTIPKFTKKIKNGLLSTLEQFGEFMQLVCHKNKKATKSVYVVV